MLDMKWIRSNKEKVQEAANLKKIKVSVEQLLNYDQERRHLLQEMEHLRQMRNEGSREIAKYKQLDNERFPSEIYGESGGFSEQDLKGSAALK